LGVNQLLTVVDSQRLEARSNMEQIQQSLSSQGILASETYSEVVRLKSTSHPGIQQPGSGQVERADVRLIVPFMPRTVPINLQVPDVQQRGP
jgi:hypothetical protein